jgi:type I restriction enzyme S subunit
MIRVHSASAGLPNGWTVQPLGKICRVRTGKKDVNEGNPTGKYPFFTCSKEIHYSDSYSFDTEAILVAGNGAVGETKYYRGKFEAYQRTYVLDSFSIFTPYLYLFLKFTLVAELAKHVSGSTMPYIRKGDLENVQIPVPPCAEQEKIARVLSVMERAIEQQERLLALTTELKKSLLHQLFTRGLRHEPQKETEIGLIPESWNEVPLGGCCHVMSGSLSYRDFLNFPPADLGEESVECMGVKVSDMNLPGNQVHFVSANVQKRLPLGFARNKLIPPNAVVFPKRGAAIATNKKRLTTTWTVLDPNLIAVYPSGSVDSNFLFHWTQTFDLKTITDPGPTPQLNKKDLTPLLIPVPPDINEQREIAAAISSVDVKLDLHRRKIEALSALFRTLSHELMTAEIRVHDLELSELESAIAA